MDKTKGIIVAALLLFGLSLGASWSVDRPTPHSAVGGISIMGGGGGNPPPVGSGGDNGNATPTPTATPTPHP